MVMAAVRPVAEHETPVEMPYTMRSVVMVMRVERVKKQNTSK